MRRVIPFVVMVGLLVGCGTDPTAQNNIGNVQLQRGQLDAAVRAYQASQVVRPDDTAPYLNAGVAFLEQGEYARAQAALEQALVTAEGDRVVAAYFALGEAHFEQRQYRLAAAAYQQVLLRRPEDEDARYNMELALSLIPTATAPPAPSPTNPDAQNPEQTETATPTQQDSQEEQVTSTPSPQPDVQDNPPTETPPNPPPDDEEGDDGVPSPMPQSEAEQILNDKQRQQSILIPQNETPIPAGAPPEKDW